VDIEQIRARAAGKWIIDLHELEGSVLGVGDEASRRV
jgi:hypothetical protein